MYTPRHRLHSTSAFRFDRNKPSILCHSWVRPCFLGRGWNECVSNRSELILISWRITCQGGGGFPRPSGNSIPNVLHKIYFTKTNARFHPRPRVRSMSWPCFVLHYLLRNSCRALRRSSSWTWRRAGRAEAPSHRWGQRHLAFGQHQSKWPPKGLPHFTSFSKSCWPRHALTTSGAPLSFFAWSWCSKIRLSCRSFSRGGKWRSLVKHESLVWECRWYAVDVWSPCTSMHVVSLAVSYAAPRSHR